MTDTDPEQRALEAAARLLARREYGRAELAARLGRGVDDEAAVARAVDRLAAAGMVDDDRFAVTMAEHRLERGWGPARIEHDLRVAGVPAEVVRGTIAGLDPARVTGAARRAVEGRDGPAALRRLIARGFTPEDM